MNCLCCYCCGQASWEKEINIGFVYVNAMLKHHKPHTSVSTETTKYDIFAAWFADSLANTNLIWVWLAKIMSCKISFARLGCLQFAYQWQTSSWPTSLKGALKFKFGSVWLRVGNLLAVSCLLSALPEVWWVKKCAECAGSRKVLRVQESLLKYNTSISFHLVSLWLFNYNSCTLHSKSVQLKVWKHLVTGFSQCLSAFQEAHWVCRNVEV